MQWFYISVLCLVIFTIIMAPLLTVQLSLSAILSSATIEIKIKGKSLFGLLRFQKEWNIADILEFEKSIEKDETEQEIPLQFSSLWDEVKNIPRNIRPFRRIINQFLMKIKINQFEWKTTIGLGDAADTGVATGVIWSLKGTLISWLRNYLSFLKNPVLIVQPNYQQTAFESNFQCMMKIKVGNAMVTAYKLAKEWKKHKKRSFSHNEKDRRIFNV
ncbi:hypothetical protein J2Z23_002335 [Lederbergia galactosidilyticus]|uniref:DUF2953 domain-containing protein n=1 Tax=Lederbergia galactosidilytica TaxID=217031 RepID=UPI001AE899FF|nr:DUF2953 domain-containing protein [Lederbergia galactosidilytica]MBP1915377.1 hypothetical protein [Lederbergia galactosidilytica]